MIQVSTSSYRYASVYFTSGAGRMTLDGETFPVNAGDTICIPPRTVHALENSGDGPLVLLCCCSPPYSHDDTELLTEPKPDFDGGTQ